MDIKTNFKNLGEFIIETGEGKHNEYRNQSMEGDDFHVVIAYSAKIPHFTNLDPYGKLLRDYITEKLQQAGYVENQHYSYGMDYQERIVTFKKEKTDSSAASLDEIDKIVGRSIEAFAKQTRPAGQIQVAIPANNNGQQLVPMMVRAAHDIYPPYKGHLDLQFKGDAYYIAVELDNAFASFASTTKTYADVLRDHIAESLASKGYMPNAVYRNSGSDDAIQIFTKRKKDGSYVNERKFLDDVAAATHDFQVICDEQFGKGYLPDGFYTPEKVKEMLAVVRAEQMTAASAAKERA